MVRIVLALLIALILLPPAAAQQNGADRYALIVGASGYRTPIRPLLGPRNDVTLIVNTLIEQGMPRERIRVLADGLNAADYPTKITPDGAPTRVAILAGLDWLAENAGADSEVLVFFAGHGSQFPSADEPDGLNEFFLPIDTRPAQTTGQPPANVLMDDELQPKLAAILNRGAFLWFVADACHSGSLSRAGETERTARFVTPEQLGATREMIAAARAAAFARGNTEVRAQSALDVALGARFVGFYAAQPEQVTYESATPKSLPGSQRRMHGEFTWSLVNAIRANRYDSYASIAQRVLAQYWDGHSDVAPYFEGSLGSRPMLGAGADAVLPVTVRNRQFYVRAGAVDGVGDGAAIALVDLSAPDNRVLARAVVNDAGMTQSRIDVSERSDPEGLVERARNEGGATAARLGARVLQRSADFVLRIAPPAIWPSQPNDAANTALVGAAARTIGELAGAERARQPVALEVSGAGEAADLYPVVARNRLWFLQRGEAFDPDGANVPYSLAAAEVNTDAMARALRVQGRTRNLLRVTRAAMDGPVSRNLAAEVFVAPGAPEADGACAVHDATERSDAPANARPVETGLATPTIDHCSMVFVRLRNNGFEPLDVTPLYVDPWSQICFIGTYTNSAYEGMRLNPGQSRIVSYTEEVPARGGARGLMHLLFIASTATGQGPARDYRYLAACGELETQDSASRDAGASGFAGLLHEAGFGDGRTRSVASDFSGGAIAIPLLTRRRD